MKIRIRDRRVSLAIMVLALALAAALGHHVVYGQNGYLTYRSEQRRDLELRQKTDTLKKENEALQKEIDALNRHDPAALEKAARGQHLARPNEKIYTYAPADSQPGGTDAQPASPPSPAPTSAGQH